MQRLKTILMVFVLGCSLPLAGQVEFTKSNDYNLQYGYSLRVALELARKPILYIAISGGIASNFIAPEVYPSINGELLIYTGGIDTAKPTYKQNWFIVDFILAGTMTVGLGSNNFTSARQSLVEGRNIPLYYFTNFNNPTLVNPFNSSFSLGTNLIWSTKRFPQRIGFINIHPVKEFQISYYNDGGPPVDLISLGDLQDRYYTGGAIISYHGPSHTLANLIEVGYHKFTGYSKNAYTAAKRLNQSFVDYTDTSQTAYNRSLWSVNVANPSRHWGINFREYNRTSWDMQHKIHWSGYSPYHLVPHKRTISLTGQYYYSTTFIGLR